MNFSEIQKLVFKEYVKNGYFDSFEKYKNDFSQRILSDIAELGLILTEVAEAIEATREQECLTKRKLEEELADIIIRTMNFATRKGIDLQQPILTKNSQNEQRPYLHGKKL